MIALRTLTIPDIVIRILLSIVFGGIIGLEREIKNRPAGLRTYILVCIGACCTMMINQYSFQVYKAGDPVRMAAEVMSGIGFLGAGTIIVTSYNKIHGLTTAAGLWASASIGLALGIGLYEVAIIGSVAIFVTLKFIQYLDPTIRRKADMIQVYIELNPNISYGRFFREVRKNNIEISDFHRVLISEAEDAPHSFTATLSTDKRLKKKSILETVRHISGVNEIEEI